MAPGEQNDRCGRPAIDIGQPTSLADGPVGKKRLDGRHPGTGRLRDSSRVRGRPVSFARALTTDSSTSTVERDRAKRSHGQTRQVRRYRRSSSSARSAPKTCTESRRTLLPSSCRFAQPPFAWEHHSLRLATTAGLLVVLPLFAAFFPSFVVERVGGACAALARGDGGR